MNRGKKIKNEISGTVFSLPYLVAKELGFFEAEGLDIEFIRRGVSGSNWMIGTKPHIET